MTRVIKTQLPGQRAAALTDRAAGPTAARSGGLPAGRQLDLGDGSLSFQPRCCMSSSLSLMVGRKEERKMEWGRRTGTAGASSNGRRVACMYASAGRRRAAAHPSAAAATSKRHRPMRSSARRRRRRSMNARRR